jgi:hypothetical protein
MARKDLRGYLRGFGSSDSEPESSTLAFTAFFSAVLGVAFGVLADLADEGVSAFRVDERSLVLLLDDGVSVFISPLFDDAFSFCRGVDLDFEESDFEESAFEESEDFFSDFDFSDLLSLLPEVFGVAFELDLESEDLEVVGVSADFLELVAGVDLGAGASLADLAGERAGERVATMSS